MSHSAHAVALGVLVALTNSSAQATDGDGRVLAIGSTMAVDIESREIAELPPETQYLLLSHPGAKAFIDDGRVKAFYGVPMTRGDSPAAVETAFWAEHAEAFGISGLALYETRSHTVGKGNFTVYAYHQTMEGLPVEDSTARLVIRNPSATAVASDDDAGEIGAKNSGRLPRRPSAGSAGVSPALSEPFVVLASGKFLAPPLGGLASLRVTPAEAVAIAQAIPPFDEGSETWPAELVVTTAEPNWPDVLGDAMSGGASILPADARQDGTPDSDLSTADELSEARPAWRIPLVTTAGPRPIPYTVFIDAANGDVLRIRLEESYTDVTGTVHGYGTPGLDPDIPTNPPNPPTQLLPLDELKVVIPEPNPDDFGWSDAAGAFTIPHGGTDAITVTASLADGRWFQIYNSSVSDTATNVLPPGPADLVLNDGSPTEATTAEVNAYVWAMKTREFWLGRFEPDDYRLDYPLLISANSTPNEPCNALFGWDAVRGAYVLSFGPASLRDDGCFHAAYSTIVTHEYTHFVQRQLGVSASDSVQEGLSDAAALLMHDTDIYSQNWRIVNLEQGTYAHERDYRPGQPARSKKYPCYSGAHECGKVLAALWCDIRANMIAELGDPGAAKEYVRQLFVDWAQFTTGGANSNAAHPLTITEILIAADDDGDLSNGVPHYFSLCSAGASHKLSVLAPPSSCGPASPTAAYHTAFWTPVNFRTSEPSGENPAGVNPHGVAVADIDGDGLRDVALACEGNSTYTGSILVYWNDTAPGVVDSVTFDSPTVLFMSDTNPPALTRPTKIAIADMGSGPGSTSPDGRLDLIVTLRSSEKVRIYYRDAGSGSRTFSTFAELTPLDGSTPVKSPTGLAVGDWDADGRQDIAVAGYVEAGTGGLLSRPVLAFFWGESSGYSTASIRIDPANSADEKGRGYDLTGWQDSPPTGMHRFAMTNFSSNSLAQIVSELYVFRQVSSGNRNLSSQIIAQFGSSRGCDHGDLNSDGRQDLIASSIGAFDKLRMILQNTDGTFGGAIDASAQIPGGGPEDVAVGLLSKRTEFPFEQDAYPDVFVGENSGTSPETRFFMHNGLTQAPFFSGLPSSFPAYLQPAGIANPRNAEICDMNDDGFLDAVISNYGLMGNDAWEGFTIFLNRNY